MKGLDNQYYQRERDGWEVCRGERVFGGEFLVIIYRCLSSLMESLFVNRRTSLVSLQFTIVVIRIICTKSCPDSFEPILVYITTIETPFLLNLLFLAQIH